MQRKKTKVQLFEICVKNVTHRNVNCFVIVEQSLLKTVYSTERG